MTCLTPSCPNPAFPELGGLCYQCASLHVEAGEALPNPAQDSPALPPKRGKKGPSASETRDWAGEAKTAPRNHPEADWQRQVIDLLRLHGFTVAHFGQGQMRIKGKMQWATPAGADGKGFPDIVALKSQLIDAPWRNVRVHYSGVAWEMKAGKNKATSEQKEWLRLFGLANFHTAIWYPEQFDEIVELLEGWK